MVAILAWPALLLVGCAETVQAPVATASTGQAYIHLNPPRPRMRRADAPCRVARVDLPVDRKEALFKQFASEFGEAAEVPGAAAAGGGVLGDARVGDARAGNGKAAAGVAECRAPAHQANRDTTRQAGR